MSETNDPGRLREPAARRVVVVGSGSWGTAITGLFARHAEEVVLWCRDAAVADAINADGANPRHLPDYRLADNVSASADAACVEDADAIVLAAPSQHLRSVAARIAPHVAPEVPVLVLTKGVEPGTDKLMADVAADELGGPERIAVLSGPNHAEEICRGKVSAAVLAASDPAIASGLRELLVDQSFRVYTSSDVAGVEVCGAVKNVIAIACGVAAGLDAGDNTLAVLMTRGLAEVARVASALGADPLTPMGLAGVGDLVATCTSQHSRNRTFGEALVAGETLEEYEERTRMVVEGARAATSVRQLAARHGVEAPITVAVDGILHEGLSLQDAMDSLLGRIPNEEFYGMAGYDGHGSRR